MQHTIRTHVRDAILCGVSAQLDDDATRAVEDVAVTATEMACRNSRPLLDFDEYRRIAL